MLWESCFGLWPWFDWVWVNVDFGQTWIQICRFWWRNGNFGIFRCQQVAPRGKMLENTLYHHFSKHILKDWLNRIGSNLMDFGPFWRGSWNGFHLKSFGAVIWVGWRILKVWLLLEAVRFRWSFHCTDVEWFERLDLGLLQFGLWAPQRLKLIAQMVLESEWLWVTWLKKALPCSRDGFGFWVIDAKEAYP